MTKKVNFNSNPIELVISEEGSQISANQKRENSAFSLQIHKELLTNRQNTCYFPIEKVRNPDNVMSL